MINIDKNNFTFKDNQQNIINAYRWMPRDGVKGIVQIAHGMTEHSLRYEDFANTLVQNGYGVYINDHLGHGMTARRKEDLGHFPKDGFNACVENMFLMTQIIKKENPNASVILLGHSMGSHLAQEYITRFGTEIEGCILSGSSGRSFLYEMASVVSSIVVMIQGPETKSHLMNRLCFGGFNKGFKPSRTDFDWLSRDWEQVDKYVNDPLCGFVCTAGFYNEYFKKLSSLHDAKKVRNVPKELPIYIISGENDPVGGYSKGVKTLISMYQDLGVKNVKFKLYPEAHHEMLMETNRGEVINDILKWLNEIT